jgi:hypothetical protein
VFKKLKTTKKRVSATILGNRLPTEAGMSQIGQSKELTSKYSCHCDNLSKREMACIFADAITTKQLMEKGKNWNSKTMIHIDLIQVCFLRKD